MLFWIFLNSIKVAETSASIAEEVTAQCLIRIYNLICKDELCSMKYLVNQKDKSERHKPPIGKI